MKTFATDPETNDFVLNREGNLFLLEGVAASAQVSKQFAATKRGEMIHAMDLGIPFFQAAFDRFPNLAQFEAALRRRLLEVPSVDTITSLEVDYDDGELRYTATLQTSDGSITING